MEDFGGAYGTDAVLLANFAAEKAARDVCDLCTGGGIVPVLLARAFPNARITGVEIDGNAVRRACENVRENGLSARVRILEGDLRDLPPLLPDGRFDLVTANPPYFPVSFGKTARGRRGAERTELLCTFEDVVRAGRYLLRQGGRFCVIHRTERLTDVLTAMRAGLLEPKRLRLIETRAERQPRLFLCEGVKCAAPGLSASIQKIGG